MNDENIKISGDGKYAEIDGKIYKAGDNCWEPMTTNQDEVREAFYKEFELESQGCSECHGDILKQNGKDQYDLDAVCNWWLQKFDTLLAKKRGEIIEKTEFAMPETYMTTKDEVREWEKGFDMMTERMGLAFINNPPAIKHFINTLLAKKRGEMSKLKAEYNEEDRYKDGVDMWGDQYATSFKAEIDEHNRIIEKCLSILT